MDSEIKITLDEVIKWLEDDLVEIEKKRKEKADLLEKIKHYTVEHIFDNA